MNWMKIVAGIASTFFCFHLVFAGLNDGELDDLTAPEEIASPKFEMKAAPKVPEKTIRFEENTTTQPETSQSPAWESHELKPLQPIPEDNEHKKIDLDSANEAHTESQKIEGDREENAPVANAKDVESDGDKALQESQQELDLSVDDNQVMGLENSQNTWTLLLVFAFAFGVLFLVYWYQRHIKGKLHSSGVPVSILGQTYLDGSTRIVLLKVGTKILILAKSSQFCNTLDVITDQDEVNLLTLSSGADLKDNDFKNVLNDLQKKADSKMKTPVANEAEIKKELSELKQQLGNLR